MSKGTWKEKILVKRRLGPIRTVEARFFRDSKLTDISIPDRSVNTSKMRYFKNISLEDLTALSECIGELIIEVKEDTKK